MNLEGLILGIAVGWMGFYLFSLLLSTIKKRRAEKALNQYMEEFKWK